MLRAGRRSHRRRRRVVDLVVGVQGSSSPSGLDRRRCCWRTGEITAGSQARLEHLGIGTDPDRSPPAGPLGGSVVGICGCWIARVDSLMSAPVSESSLMSALVRELSTTFEESTALVARSPSLTFPCLMSPESTLFLPWEGRGRPGQRDEDRDRPPTGCGGCAPRSSLRSPPSLPSLPVPRYRLSAGAHGRWRTELTARSVACRGGCPSRLRRSWRSGFGRGPRAARSAHWLRRRERLKHAVPSGSDCSAPKERREPGKRLGGGRSNQPDPDRHGDAPAGRRREICAHIDVGGGRRCHPGPRRVDRAFPKGRVVEQNGWKSVDSPVRLAGIIGRVYVDLVRPDHDRAVGVGDLRVADGPAADLGAGEAPAEIPARSRAPPRSPGDRDRCRGEIAARRPVWRQGRRDRWRGGRFSDDSLTSAPVSASSTTFELSTEFAPRSPRRTFPCLMSPESTLFFPGSAPAVPAIAKQNSAMYPTTLLRRCSPMRDDVVIPPIGGD